MFGCVKVKFKYEQTAVHLHYTVINFVRFRIIHCRYRSNRFNADFGIQLFSFVSIAIINHIRRPLYLSYNLILINYYYGRLSFM